ncbi:MAG: hypothetical protein LBH75_03570 [Treponema sp.]|jgi:hypothetical protein|nr:hypothetical protein [Treponema sp.]
MKKILLVGLAALAAGTILLLAGCYDSFAIEDEVEPFPTYTTEIRTYTIPAEGGAIEDGDILASANAPGNLEIGNFFQGENSAIIYRIIKGHTYRITFRGTTSVDIPRLTAALGDWSNNLFDAVDWENKQSITATGGEQTLTWTVTANASSSTAQSAKAHNMLILRAEKPNESDTTQDIALGVDVTLRGIFMVEDL